VALGAGGGVAVGVGCESPIELTMISPMQ